MTPKQKAFLQYYLQYGDGRAAAIAAGYKGKSAGAGAARLLRLPEIQAEIQANSHDRIAGPEEILEYLTSIMRAESGDVGVREQMRAAELLGKSNELFGRNDREIVTEPVIFQHEEDIE